MQFGIAYKALGRRKILVMIRTAAAEGAPTDEPHPRHPQVGLKAERMNRRQHFLHPDCAALEAVCRAGLVLLDAVAAVEACTGAAAQFVAEAAEACTGEVAHREADFAVAEACMCGRVPSDFDLAAL